jgi:hypothetical protein
MGGSHPNEGFKQGKTPTVLAGRICDRKHRWIDIQVAARKNRPSNVLTSKHQYPDPCGKIHKDPSKSRTNTSLASAIFRQSGPHARRRMLNIGLWLASESEQSARTNI